MRSGCFSASPPPAGALPVTLDFTFGVSRMDALTFGLVPVVLVLVALFACIVPARRAMQVDPTVALRSGQ